MTAQVPASTVDLPRAGLPLQPRREAPRGRERPGSCVGLYFLVMNTKISLAVAAALLTGCAGVRLEEPDTARAECAQYTFYDLPSIAKVFGTEPMPSECLPAPGPRHPKWERVVVVNADGGYRSVMVPAGSRVVTSSAGP